METFEAIIRDIHIRADKKKALLLQRFFKTGKGEYGEGDIFLGLVMPQVHMIVLKYKKTATLEDIRKLLETNIHEYRMVALLLLVEKCKKATPEELKQFADFYLTHTRYINNWDLVDLSSHKVVGRYLVENPKERNILLKLAKSKSLWERRIAMISCAAFIGNNQFNDALAVAQILLHDEHDLIHKAVGWMLREIGKRDQKVEEDFLLKRYTTMPRTMLRYAIERFPEPKRRFYLKR